MVADFESKNQPKIVVWSSLYFSIKFVVEPNNFLVNICFVKSYFLNQIRGTTKNHRKMKNILILILLVFTFMGCKDASEKANEKILQENSEISSENPEEKPENDTDRAQEFQISAAVGVFMRKDAAASTATCNCNCVEINFQQTTTLCLDAKSGLSIMATFEKVENSTANIYYVQPEHTDNPNDEKIPWDTFDTKVPIAVIHFSGEDSFEMDWKGFSINGEIAKDYAIYGKKNLEGEYIRKQ